MKETKNIDKEEAKEEIKTPEGIAKVVLMFKDLEKLSTKQLVKYAKDEFDISLNLNNGRPWLFKKVGYMLQEKHSSLPKVAAERAKELDNPEIIDEHKKKAAVEDKKLEDKPKKESSSKKETKGVDEDGFRIDSKGSEMFALLKKGTTMDKLNEVGGAAVKGFLGGITHKLGDCPAGREAKLEKTEKNIRIIQHKTKDGKLHKLVD